MAYFTKFPIVTDYDVGDKTYDMMDITRRTGFATDVKNNESYYLEHYVQDGETPIVLADRMYDDSSLFWVIMMFNDIFDINSQWPLNEVALKRFVYRVYDDPYDVKCYRSIATGAIVDSDWPDYDKQIVTNYEYEIEINDAKRNIKVPIPEAVTELVKEHNRLISL